MKEITRLLGSWPSAAAPADGDEQLRSYLLAVEDYPAQDVEAAVVALIKGVAPGVNPNFLPAPAAVGAECHRQNHLRADREDRERRLRPALPPPGIERTRESQTRVRELVERTVSGLRSADEDTPEARYRAQLRKANAYFDAERGYSAGDPDGDEAAA